MSQLNPMLSVRGIHKSFGTNAVLKGIDLDVRPGEVMALIGGNGAGKSTLVKIIMGIYQPDCGDVLIKGVKAALNKPSDALAHGIYLVPQEPMLFPNMTVSENVIMGFHEKKRELEKRLAALLAQLKWNLDPGRKAGSLSIAEQQLVEILRGLLRNARILFLDEPTSALTFDEVNSLFSIIKDLKRQGISMIYITHRLTEVFDIATHVAIMRDGIVTSGGPVAGYTREMLVNGLLPPDATQARPHGEKPSAPNYAALEPVLSLEDFGGYGFSNVTLSVYPGEILGLAGVVGAGRTELATTIFGRDAIKSGKAYLNGKDITGLSTREIIKAGITYVPEDRRLNGIFPISDVAANTTAACLDKAGRFFLNRKWERGLTDKYIRDLRVVVTGHDQQIGSLSGGNQQKVVLGRALSTSPRLIILDEPTRGIDAGARTDVYAIIHQLKAQGEAVLLISSDIEEVVELSDRAATMFQGCINHVFAKDSITEDNLMAASFGVYTDNGGDAV